MKPLLLCCVLTLGVSHVLGIDLGTSFTKVAMVQPGAGLSFAIVENTKSERKTETAISFFKGSRYYESEAISKRTKSTPSTFLYTKMFIDLLDSPKELESIRKEYFLDHQIRQNNGLIQFVLEEGFKDKLEISIQQIFGMIFKHVKHLAEKMTSKGVKIKDCVITVPCHWTPKQRIVIQNALRIAELNPLSIVTQNTAAAVHYGVNRGFNSTHKVVFYNLGSNNLEISVAEFRKSNSSKKQPDEIHVLGEYGQSNIGGLQLDLLIASRLEKVYQSKHNKDLTQKGRVRVLSESTKIKEVLSANKDVHVSIEELDGVDFHTVILRSDLEHESSELLRRLVAPISTLLKSVDLVPKDITYVQLIGGSTRIPKLQEMIIEAMKPAEVGTHINGDESMAFGSAFLAANSSKKYKVKGLNLYDGWNFDVVANIKNLDESIEEGDSNFLDKTVKVFKKGQRFGLIKDLLLKTKDNVLVSFWTEKDDEKTLIKTIRISNISDYRKTYPDASPKLSLSLRTNPVSVIDMVEARLAIVRDEESAYLEQIKKEPKPREKRKVKQADGEKTEQTLSKSIINNNTNSTKTPNISNNTNSTNTQNISNRTEEDEYETVRRTKIIQKTHYLKLAVSEEGKLPPLLEGKALESSQKILYIFQKQELEQRRLSEARNRLESSIYQAQDLLDSQLFKEFASESQLSQIKEGIDNNEQKVYEDLDADTFKELHQHFYKGIEVIKTRRTEFQERDKVKTSIERDIESYKKRFLKLEEDSNWLTEEDKEPFSKTLRTVETQLSESYSTLSTLPKTETPGILNRQLLKLVDKVKEQFLKVSSIPKPKKTKKEEEGQEKDKQKGKQKEKEEKKPELDQL